MMHTDTKFKGELHMQIRQLFNEIFNKKEPYINDANHHTATAMNGAMHTSLHDDMHNNVQNENHPEPNRNGSEFRRQTSARQPASGLPDSNAQSISSWSENNLPKELEEAMELLYAYIEAELDGLDAAAEFPKVHAAIQSSEEAALQYHELKDILNAEREGNLIIPSKVPDFDFSYLQLGKPSMDEAVEGSIAVTALNPDHSSKGPTWYWMTETGSSGLPQLRVRFSPQLISAFEHTPLQNSPALRNHMKSGSKSKVIFSYEIDQREEHDLVVEFEATESAGSSSVNQSDTKPEFCNLTIKVDRPSIDGAPFLADSRIYLSFPGNSEAPDDSEDLDTSTLPRRSNSSKESSEPDSESETIVQSTNPFGATTFRQIPIADLPKLTFTIEPAPLK